MTDEQKKAIQVLASIAVHAQSKGFLTIGDSVLVAEAFKTLEVKTDATEAEAEVKE